ncbi:hypothetical protein GCM10010307_62380 [Streptomyces vastus]|uniref:Uncharacterized protein n=1 Tax=Streptomyces vastus TaxID=285451 RepID=A0ABP6DUP4_9ACTN
MLPCRERIFECVFDSVVTEPPHGALEQATGTASEHNQQEQRHDEPVRAQRPLVRDEPAEWIKGGANVWCGAST